MYRIGEFSKLCGLSIKTLRYYAEKVKELGIEDVIVEQDNALNYPDPFGQMAQSANCLHRLF